MEKLTFPRFNIPGHKSKPTSPAVFYEWLIENLLFLHDSGRLARIRRQAHRRPVDARFVL
ncbi:MAG: hypothetical protein A2498_09650 [Lentisphaerae bacterium RIFOXYC12_FULL_60_16]|nr:MAG: hypothetical protein A2498_09650 [Lentisphaerae bacterium RIFOXYC12_FULL_60_16]OGV78484.1 MAG: hypothetical protein A2340_07510 [Lentisphaerae bacterium RIFOXYB12_FULL_60_10]